MVASIAGKAFMVCVLKPVHVHWSNKNYSRRGILYISKGLALVSSRKYKKMNCVVLTTPTLLISQKRKIRLLVACKSFN